MRILLLSQWFDPEPIFKGLPFARELAAQGHEVEVLTGFPNYPGGKLYPGYRVQLWQREVMDGIPVTRVPLYPSHDESGLKRALNYTSFAFSAALLGALLTRRPDVIYVYHPPATVGFPAMVLSLLKRVPFVYDVQDLWPDTLAATGMMGSPRVLALVGRWCDAVYRRAARVVVLSEGFSLRLQERGVPERNIQVISNWCDETQIVPVETETKDAEFKDRFNIVFAGTMGKAQALDTVLDAAALVGPLRPEIQFVLIGGGVEVENLKRQAQERQLENVLFLPRRPFSEIGAVLAQANALLVHLRNDPLFEITIPSKTQAYMFVGKPILMALEGDAAQLVKDAQAGVTCPPENPPALAQAAIQLADLPLQDLEWMGKNGAKYYRERLSLAVGTRHFLEVFDEALRESRRGPFNKRLLDLLASSVGLMVLSPVLLGLAFKIRQEMGSPVLFRQQRPGLWSRTFTMYKFRTMRDALDAHGQLLPDSERLTPLGRFLRSSSLDELPELFNVLRGEMSLVGPRPLLTEYLERYTPEQARRHEVRPGITGWAQVNGRNAISWEEKFKLDVWYVDNRSLALDLKILWLTLVKVFKREGISASGEATMPVFQGTAHHKP
ncbi:UDP-phosphate galactose phosphotransferase [Deinococcus irradiatisoli]|uniref:UDP-phosphate galactose phosphotransferase n=1 Tax=Deinococcus irradiatisoli TaxID=2202254 RepID=A0A2Z3JKA4_9DEIO|nr:sugar transferase [Deinococcus irradiatisoli]AWN23740.1 UDP-phosphate galactose phosphotransferase [Deinococcus irradiatisoli]